MPCKRTLNVLLSAQTIAENKRTPLPVVYLLHGYSGNYSNWIMKVPELKKYADEYKLMIVCPDGALQQLVF